MIARFAFNELVSFIAGWAICLDYLILIAICAFATTDYAAVFVPELESGAPEFLMAAALVLFVAWWNARGSDAPRYNRAVLIVLGDLALQLLIVAFGLLYLFEPEVLTDPASIAGTPSIEDVLFAFPLVLVAFSGLDASSGLAGQVAIGRRGLRRLISVRMLAALVPYVGIALVASATLPVERAARAPDGGSRRRCSAWWPTSRRSGCASRCATWWPCRRSRSWPPRATRRCSASRGWATRSRSTARSRRGSATCTRTRRRRW